MITRFPKYASSRSSIRRLVPQSTQRCLHLSDSEPSLRRLSPFQYHIRQYTTPPPANIPTDLRSQLVSNPPPPPPHEPVSSSLQPTPKRSLRPYIYASFFLLLGLTAGQYVRLILAPPPLPPAGTKEDNLMVDFITTQAEKLPIVCQLSNDPAWTSHDAYGSLSSPERSARLTTGALAGARALGGFQRVFSNKETGELVLVIWFGGAIAGWPGVTHGGATATILDETLGRCAMNFLKGRTGVTANLELQYLKPIVTNSFYVVRATPEEGANERKAWISGQLETVDGRVCVKSRALFVVPKGYTTKEIKSEF